MDMSSEKSKISGLPEATNKIVANNWSLDNNTLLLCLEILL